MRGTNMVRSQHCPSCIIPDFGQVTEDRVKISAGNKSRDVFQECVAGSNETNGVPGGRPHIPVVSCSFAPPCRAEGLARESCRDDINQSRICCGVPVTIEYSDIAKDRSGVEDAVGDPLSEDALAIRVVFDISNTPPS